MFASMLSAYVQCPQLARRGHQIPCYWGDRWLWASIRALGTNPGSYGRAVNPLNHWAFSPAPVTCTVSQLICRKETDKYKINILRRESESEETEETTHAWWLETTENGQLPGNHHCVPFRLLYPCPFQKGGCNLCLKDPSFTKSWPLASHL